MQSFKKAIYKSHKRKGVVILPPIVMARVDKKLSSSESSFFLTATGNAPSGNIVSRTWTEVSGASTSTYNIQNPTVYGSNLTDSDFVENVTGLTGNDYIFKIEITDSNGLTASDTFSVTRVSDSIAFEVTNRGNYPSSDNPSVTNYPTGSFQVTGATQYYVWLYVETASGATSTSGAIRQVVSVDIKNINGTLTSLNAQSPPGSRVYSSQSILVSRNSTSDVFYIDQTNLWQPFGGFSSWISGFAFNTVNDPTTATDLYVQPV